MLVCSFITWLQNDARSLLETLKDDNYPELYPDAVAQSKFEVAPLPTCRSSDGWQDLWPIVQQHVENFLLCTRKTFNVARLGLSCLGTKMKKIDLESFSIMEINN